MVSPSQKIKKWQRQKQTVFCHFHVIRQRVSSLIQKSSFFITLVSDNDELYRLSEKCSDGTDF
jgi:hypothetical protein